MSGVAAGRWRGIGSIAAARAGGPVGTGASGRTGISAWVVPRVAARVAARARGSRARDRRLAGALRVVAASARSGRSLQVAFSDAGERTGGVVGAAFMQASARLALGVAIDRAADLLARDVGGPAARLFADVVAIQHRRGGDVGALCHRLARLLHERIRLDDEARSLTAQARFTARAVLGLPALVLVGWAWLAPESLRAMLTPGMLVVLSPAAVLLACGIAAVRSLARAACDQDRAWHEVGGGAAAGATGRHPVRGHSRLLARIAGSGSVERQSARTTAFAAALVVPVALAGGATPVSVVGMLAAIGCAAAWPTMRSRAERERLVAAADAGIATLLELSIALLAAGATVREVATGAIESCPGPLGELLRPASAQVALGRTVESAMLGLEVVQGSPDLDAWVHAITAGERLGAPLGEVLDTMLRDARSRERERFRSRAATMAPRMQLATVLLIVPAIMWVVLVATTHGLLAQLADFGVLAAP